MTSYHLGSLKLLEESLRQEMVENERRKSMKVIERKQKLEVTRHLETSLQDAQLRLKRRDYKNALVFYSEALENLPNDKWRSCQMTCLVARSKCYLKLGDPHSALKDAEAALEEDKEFNKGLYQKAEALYSMGEFEYALMYYHRGHKLRPELDEFRLGIQKAQEAIDNSIGNAARVKLENKGDLSFFAKQDDLGKKTRGYSKPTSLNKPKVGGNRNKETKAPAPSNKTVKQLLGELYADKEYLEKLMKDSDFIQNEANKKIHDLVQDGLSYLETRTEFWRQQKPLYARKKTTQKSGGKTRDKTKSDLAEHIIKKLEEIDSALSDGEAQRSLKLAQSTLKDVDAASVNSLSNKDEIIANLHSCIGNAFLDLEKPAKALKHHNKDLEISQKKNIKDGKSRALDNIGRSHARMGNFSKAIEVWKEKLPLVKTPLESTWLRHEIGRCHLELGNYTEAREFGEESLVAAVEADDNVWQLNASVLIAQADVKLGDLKQALKSFDNSMDLAKTLDDEAAKNAISKAVDDLKAKIGAEDQSESEEDKEDESKDEEAKTEDKDDDASKNDNENEVKPEETKSDEEVEDGIGEKSDEPQGTESETEKRESPDLAEKTGEEDEEVSNDKADENA